MKLDNETLTGIKSKIEALVQNGSSEMHALSTICQTNGLNILDVAKQIGYTDFANQEETKDDVSVGSYVVLKNNPDEKYEIINIFDDEYILMNISNNEVINVKQNEITPIVMENNMTNLNEAQYTVSINNLETTDADTLSQMLSLAGQAEGGEADMVATELPTVASVEPAPMDAEPTTEFEPTLSAEMDGPGFEAAEVDNYETPLAPEEAPSMEVEEVALNEGDIKEDVLIPTNKEEEMKDSSSEENLEKEEVNEDDFDADIAETLRIAGVQLDEVSEEEANKGKKDLPVPPVGKANPAKTADVPEGQAPDYKEVSTEDVTGYDSSKGFETPANLKLESTVNQNRINAILETAKNMYAKKDRAMWNVLDRRYITKLIQEGVGSDNAMKLVQKAKLGK